MEKANKIIKITKRLVSNMVFGPEPRYLENLTTLMDQERAIQ